MKKNIRHKKASSGYARAGQDASGLFDKIQQQLASLEKKIDILINPSLQRHPEAKSFPAPFRQSGHNNDRGNRGPDNNYRERTMHKAVCADCKSECEVPFKPTGERPVYCKDCFAKRKSGSSFRERPDARPRGEAAFRDQNIGRRQSEEHHGAGAKKRAPARKRKSK